MGKTIVQRVRFSVPADELFETYMSSRRHAAATGSKVTIGRKAGDRFAAFTGGLRGKNLLIVPKRLIVQAWREGSWRKRDPDSILVLAFRRVRGGGEIGLTHANVPDHAYPNIRKGWDRYYWRPWRRYFARRRKT